MAEDDCESSEVMNTFFICKVASASGSESELIEVLRTIRYHYLWKVYLPMYRILHWLPPNSEDSHQCNAYAGVVSRQKKLESDQNWKNARHIPLASAPWVRNHGRSASGSRFITRSSFHRQLQLQRLRTEGCGAEEREEEEEERVMGGGNGKGGSTKMAVRITGQKKKAAVSADTHASPRHHHRIRLSASTGRPSFSRSQVFALPSSVDGNRLSICCTRKLNQEAEDRFVNNPQLLICKQASPSNDHNREFQVKQTALQEEAKLALAAVQPMACMQLQVEKQGEKRLMIPSLAATVVEKRCDGMVCRSTLGRLNRMNLTQLKLIAKDFTTLIEGLNEKLMSLLEERDELHMEQDSVLVDIDDFTRRAQEMASAAAAAAEAAKRGNGERMHPKDVGPRSIA